MERGGAARLEANNSGKVEFTREATEANVKRDAKAEREGEGVSRGRGEREG